MNELDHMRRIVEHDLDGGFLRDICLKLPWEYDRLYETLKADTALTDAGREEEFSKRRGMCAVHAIVSAAQG